MSNPNKRIVIVMHSMAGARIKEFLNAAKFSCQSTRFAGQSNHLANCGESNTQSAKYSDNLRTTDYCGPTVPPKITQRRPTSRMRQHPRQVIEESLASLAESASVLASSTDERRRLTDSGLHDSPHADAEFAHKSRTLPCQINNLKMGSTCWQAQNKFTNTCSIKIPLFAELMAAAVVMITEVFFVFKLV